MPKTHTVHQGEHLPGIAAKYGFADYRTIWDDSHNAELKNKRQNPNVLFPGDTLYIPDKQQKKAPCATGGLHRFQARVERLRLRFTLKDVDGRPIANTPCELTLDGSASKLSTDADGRIETEVSKTAQSGKLKLKDLEIPVKIGHLDPIDEVSGIRARLTNLGYYRGPQDPVDEMELLSAIEEFQCDSGLKVTGACDASTVSKLKEAHGC